MLRERLRGALPWYALASALVLADQVVKGWVRATMILGETRPFLPHLIELYYVENTGGAFSIFHRYTWLLTLLSAGVTVALALALWKGRYLSGVFDRLCAALLLAGAAGNLIDRVGYGKVTDMFNFTFIRFGVFNVADVCVVGGVIGYACYALFNQGKKTPAETDGDEHEADADRSR